MTVQTMEDPSIAKPISKQVTAAQASNTKKKLILRIVAAVAVLGISYFIYDYIFFVSTDNAQIQANTVIMTSRVSGFITKVNVEDGQKVKAGDVLVELDPKDFKQSDWFGSKTGPPPRQIGGNGRPVIGVSIRSGSDVDNLGLVQLR